MREAEAKYHPDLDSDKDKDLDSDKDLFSDTDRESSSSDDFVYVQKPKTNKFKCEECNEEFNHLNIKRTHDYVIEIKLLRVLMRME